MTDDVIDTVRGEDGQYLAPSVMALLKARAASPDPQIVAFIQHMIDTSFIKHDILHGHLSETDGAILLAKVTT